MEDAIRALLINAGIPCRVTYYYQENYDGLVEIDCTTYMVQVGKDSLSIMREAGTYDIRPVVINVPLVDLVRTLRRVLKFASKTG